MDNNQLFCKVFLIFAATVMSLTGSGQISDANSSVAGKGMVLITGLKYSDIGRVIKSGSVTINKNEIKIEAAGSDIWGKHDEFYFGYKMFTGDFDIQVQVVSLTSAHKYTKAGIMARANLSDSSQHVYYQVFPDNSARNKNNGGCEFQYRLASGGDMKAVYPDPGTSGSKFNVAYPDTWIRLKRQGNTFESYFSNGRKTWNLYTKFDLIMPAELFVGLAVTSHNKSESTIAVFESFGKTKL
jgi:regulation of enolase protein 1 (concanavalin A-like superfamily)